MKKLFLMAGLGIMILLGSLVPSGTEAVRRSGIHSFRQYLQRWGTMSRLKWRKPLPRLRYRYHPSSRRSDYLRQRNLPRPKYITPTAEETGGITREERKKQLDEARAKRLCGRKYLPQYQIDQRQCTCNTSDESSARHFWECKLYFTPPSPPLPPPPPSSPPSSEPSLPDKISLPSLLPSH